ncbi:MAG TPA: oligosaccharide flippase family protein, partial [Candidatus Goldiibacteriota bacterium]|nr:oligosaccharide flippase family protein [Candidatus Goldiibacteriota bacterium]
LILFIASSVVNASNFVFHMYATRNLKPEEYGVLATMLGMIMIFTMPAMSFQMAVVKKTSSLKARERFGAIEFLFKRATMLFLSAAILSFGILFLMSRFIGDFFKIEDSYLVLITGGILIISFLVPVVRGILQGLQRFMGLGSNMIIDAVSRLIFLVLLISAGFGVRGSLLASLFSAVAAYIAGLILIRPIFKYKEEAERGLIKKREILGHSVPVLAAMLGFSLLSYMDLFMVKHFFSREEAGFYAVTSIIGKAFLFFPAAIVMALFPKVAEHTELNRKSGTILAKGLGLTAAISAAGIIFCAVFPEFVIKLLTGGDKYLAISGVVRLFGVAILPLVLFNVVLNYSLASRRHFFILFIYAGAALYAGLLWFFHDSFYRVLSVMFGVNVLVLAAGLASLLAPAKKAEAQ